MKLAAIAAIAATPVFAIDLINCSVGKHLKGQGPGYDCGVKMGWTSGYVGSDTPNIGGLWARDMSSAEIKKFAACCHSGGKNSYYETGVNRAEWDFLHAACMAQGSLGGRALDLLQGFIAGLIAA
ncbi:hypothetical protein BC940DRAFT_366187 [Gongronella butleri]|nr:hypothetical protein BC940DRAFT_366187 [Gongronella butleri]